MKYYTLALLLLLPLAAKAADPNAMPKPQPVTQSPGRQDYAKVKNCIMQNDKTYCHSIITPNSYDIYDRFLSYKLMPCLPTDFTYDSEENIGPNTTVKLTMPASKDTMYIVRLVFIQGKLDIPATLQRGLGDKWENKIQLAEQLYLMMKQNMGDKLTCDQLNDLIKK